MLARAVVLALLTSAPAIAQQTIRVRLLDGRTGKAITKAQVSISTYRDYAVRQVQAIAEADGYRVSLSTETSIGLGDVSKSTSAGNAYELCASGQSVKPIFSVADILSKGIVAPNECSTRINVAPSRGEIIFFVKPRTLWERIRDYQFPS